MLPHTGPVRSKGAKRIFLAIRVSLSAAIATFILGSVLLGLRQQSPNLPDDDIQCDYRRDILSNQLTTFTKHAAYEPQERSTALTKFSTLLRETREVCDARSGDPELLHDLDIIQRQFEDYRRQVPP